MAWTSMKLSGSGGLADRASRRLRNDELLLRTFAATILRKHMDDVPLWRGNHMVVRELVAYFAQYVYLPRLGGPQVLMDTIQNGVSSLTWESDTFALAEGYDEGSKRYFGLQTGRMVIRVVAVHSIPQCPIRLNCDLATAPRIPVACRTEAYVRISPCGISLSTTPTSTVSW